MMTVAPFHGERVVPAETHFDGMNAGVDLLGSDHPHSGQFVDAICARTTTAQKLKWQLIGPLGRPDQFHQRFVFKSTDILRRRGHFSIRIGGGAFLVTIADQQLSRARDV